MARTRRGHGYVSPGAVAQHGGKLPAYACNTCNSEVVWVESKKTGKHYLVDVSYGYNHNRYYVGRNFHDCEKVLARRKSFDEQWQKGSV